MPLRKFQFSKANQTRLGQFGPWLVLFGLILSCHQTILIDPDLLPGDLGDGRFVPLLLEHTYQYLSSNWIHNFWQAPWNFYPFRLSISMSEVMSGNMIIYYPLRMAGLSWHESFRWWIILSSAMNFASAWWALRLVRFSSIAATAGAVLFAFGMPRTNQLNHLHLWPQYFGIFSLCMLSLGLSSASQLRTHVYFILAGILMGLQFWTSLHLGWFTGFAVMISALVATLTPVRAHVWKLLREKVAAIGSAILSFAVVASPLMSKLGEFAEINGGMRTYDRSIFQYMPKLASWLLPAEGTQTHKALFSLVVGRAGHTDEVAQFCGFVALIATLYFAISCSRKRSWFHWKDLKFRLAMVSGMSFVFFVAIVSRDGLFGRWGWHFIFNIVPGADGIRAVGRIAFAQIILQAVCTAGLVDLLRKKSNSVLVCIAITALVIVENYVVNGNHYRLSEHQMRVDRVSEWRISQAEAGCRVFGVMPIPENVRHWEPDVLWDAITAQVFTVNGYSGYLPPGYNPEVPRKMTVAQEWLSNNGVKLDETKICLGRIEYSN